VFASHHWPRFGAEPARAFLESQRDAYRYIHDQTLRLANHGLTMDEIAEGLELPDGLGDEFFNRDYYGTVSHNSKAVYQRYLGWFDGNPAHLHRHPPEEAARRYVEYMGGADAAIERARSSFAEGDYRWVAEVLSHVVFADPGNERARLLEADALEQLGYAAESGPWRDFYLTGAQELRAGGTVLAGLPGNALAADVVRAMTVEMLVDLLGVRLNGPGASGLDVRIDLDVRDLGERHALRVRRGTVSLRQGRGHERPDVTLSAGRDALAALVAGNRRLEQLESAGEIEVAGDRAALGSLLAALDEFSFGFEVVLP
jgi:alkyl sulfatase BDS1-like metallo-beta-lactamase superfamily hydrolase